MDRRVLLSMCAALVAFFAVVGSAAAQSGSAMIGGGDGSSGYVGGDAGSQSLEMGFCNRFGFQDGYYYYRQGVGAPEPGSDDVDDCPRSADVVLPPDDSGGGVPDPMVILEELPEPGEAPDVMAILDQVEPPGGGGGEPPSLDDIVGQLPSAPPSDGPGRECTSQETDMAGTCLDDPTGGNQGFVFFGGDEGGPQGEFGLCTVADVPVGGPGYYFLAGPSNPTGGASGDCPESPASPPADADGDGVADGQDTCPSTAAGDRPVNPSGCGPAQRDTDGDGVKDDVDQCDDVQGPASNNGCPVQEPADGDGDGVADAEDNCPTVANPSQANAQGGSAAGDACEDQDGDSVVDADDGCAAQAGPADNDGCPVQAPADADGDGVPDADDRCPAESGPADNGGCPVQAGGGDGDQTPAPSDPAPTGEPASTGDPAPPAGDPTALPAPQDQGDPVALSKCLKKAKKIDDRKKRRKAVSRCHEKYGPAE